MARRLNDMDSETIEKNFLEEIPESIPTEQKVVVANEIPKYEKVIFMNNRDPGCALFFHYKTLTHPLKHYTLMHGQTYDLPTEVIRHLEGQNDSDPYTCHSRLYGLGKNDLGNDSPVVNGYKPYFQCRSVRT